MSREKEGIGARIDEMINGTIIGFTQVLVGHPFDTIKTLKQNRHSTRDIKLNSQIMTNYATTSAKSIYGGTNMNIVSRNRWGRLYKGIKYPAYISCAYNAGCFGIYTWGIDVKKWSPFGSGMLAGVVLGSLSTPFEYYKIQKQTEVCCRKRINYISMGEIRRWLPGVGITTCREGLASGCYFGVYEWLHSVQPMIAITGGCDFVNGGVAGCSSWLLTYPIDTIKTRRQSLSPAECIRTSWSKLVNMKGSLYGGLGICLMRAFVVNGITFQLYELLHVRS